MLQKQKTVTVQLDKLSAEIREKGEKAESEEALRERKDKYHSEAMDKLCANERSAARAYTVEVLQQRLDQSKATRAIYKKHY